MTLDFDPASILRSARERSGLTQRALADRAGTSQSVVARIERGQSSPTVGTLNRLLEATGHRIESRLVPTSDGFRTRARAQFEGHAPAGIAAAYLYGSTARGMRHQESDVDIGVLVDREAYPERSRRSEPRVRLASDPVAALGIDEVDVVVLNDEPPGLATRIVLDGTLLTVGDAEQVHAFTRDVQLRRADLAPFLERAARLKRQALARGPTSSSGSPNSGDTWTTCGSSVQELVKDLARLPGLRNILVHEYVGLDYVLVIEALDNLGPVEDFLRSALARVEDWSVSARHHDPQRAASRVRISAINVGAWNTEDSARQVAVGRPPTRVPWRPLPRSSTTRNVCDSSAPSRQTTVFPAETA